MKSALALCILTFTFLTNFVSAQRPIRIKEDSITYGTSRYPGIIVQIPEVGYDKTEKNWIKEIQTGTKSKVITENGEMSIFGANIRDISPNPLNIYSKLINGDSAVQLLVSFELKKDFYISSINGDGELMSAREYLKEFAKSQYINLVKVEVADEERKLRDLTTELNRLQNEKSRMERSIQSNINLIDEMKEKIVLLNNELATVSSELVTQNDQLGQMEAGSAKDQKASEVKELEKRKKRIRNEIESAENRITRANSAIKDVEREIPINESDQEIVRSKISIQQEVVNKFTQKLNTVRAY